MSETRTYTATEIAIKLDMRIGFLNHLISRGAVDIERTEDGLYIASDETIASINESRKRGREELRYVFNNREEIRRRAVNRMVVEASGVDKEIAKRLGYDY